MRKNQEEETIHTKIKENCHDRLEYMVVAGSITNVVALGISGVVGLLVGLAHYGLAEEPSSALQNIISSTLILGSFNIITTMSRNLSFEASMKEMIYYAPGSLAGLYGGMSLIDMARY